MPRIESERLRQIIRQFQLHRFGRRAERLPEAQLQLAPEDAEQEAVSGQAASEQKNPAERKARATRRRTNRGKLPAHLTRLETVIYVESPACPCCKGALHCIGEDVAERVDIVPAQFRALDLSRHAQTQGRGLRTSLTLRPGDRELIRNGRIARSDEPLPGL